MQPLPAELDQPGALQGLSAYTTLRTRHGQPLLPREHLERLTGTCLLLDLPAPDHALPVLDPWPWGLLRLTVLPGGTYWSHRPLPRPDVGTRGAAVWLSRQQVHPQLGRHKTGNALPYLLARREAEEQGAFEALLTDASGQVADGSRSGLLLHLDGRWTVPDGGLPSVTRTAWLAELGVQADVSPVSADRLRAASGVWLCGSGIGIMPVGGLRADGWSRSYPVCWPQTRHPAFVVPGSEWAGSGAQG